MTRPTTALLNAAHDQVNYWYDKAKKLDEELAKAEERIAELEARPIVVPAEKELPDLYMSEYQENVGWNDAVREVRRMNAVASPLAVKLPEAFRSFVADDDIKALHRFAECCDDPDAGGHDLEPEQVQRLVNIGILRKSGRNYHETTHFGDFVLSFGQAEGE